MTNGRQKTDRRCCLVLGGTGHIGNALARALLRGGHAVSVACRWDGGRPNLEGLSVCLLTGDDRRSGQLEDWIRGHDLVIDAAAPYPLRLFDPDQSRQQHIEMARERSRRLITAMATADAELVYVSSFTTLAPEGSWYGRMQSAIIQESHPYFETKRAIEQDVLAAAAKGLRAVIVNPSVCLGPWDLKPPEACFVASVARGDLLGISAQPMNVIDVRDVAEMTLKALERQCYGQPIPLSGHNTDLASLVRAICRRVGRAPPRLQGSTRLAAFGAYWTDALFGAFRQAPPVSSLPFLLLCECRPMHPSAAQQALGVTPRALDTTLEDTLRWYREIGYC